MPDGSEHRRSGSNTSQGSSRRRRERDPRAAPLDGDARRLIAEHVDSVGALDLLVLVRDQPGRWWAVGDICEALRCPPGWATLHLESLHAADVLEANEERDRGYRFRPRDPGVAETVDAVADAYATRPREVVKLIFSLRT